MSIKDSNNIDFNYMFVKTIKKTHENYDKYRKLAIEKYSFLLLDENKKKIFIKSTVHYTLVLEIIESVFEGKIQTTETLKLYLRCVLPGDDEDD